MAVTGGRAERPVAEGGRGAAADEPKLANRSEKGWQVLALTGAWTTARIADRNESLRQAAQIAAGRVRIDLTGVTALDTAGAWLVQRTQATLERRGLDVELQGGNEAQRALIERIARFDTTAPPEPPAPPVVASDSAS